MHIHVCVRVRMTECSAHRGQVKASELQVAIRSSYELPNVCAGS